MTDKLISEKSVQLRFERKASPVFPEHRPFYKIAQILLILNIASIGGKSSLPRLHLFNWAMKSIDRQKILIRASNEGSLSLTAWGFDPVLAIAIRIAIAEHLMQENSTGYQITDMGKDFIGKVLQDSSLLKSERLFLQSVGKRITEAIVKNVASSWRI